MTEQEQLTEYKKFLKYQGHTLQEYTSLVDLRAAMSQHGIGIQEHVFFWLLPKEQYLLIYGHDFRGNKCVKFTCLGDFNGTRITGVYDFIQHVHSYRFDRCEVHNGLVHSIWECGKCGHIKLETKEGVKPLNIFSEDSSRVERARGLNEVEIVGKENVYLVGRDNAGIKEKAISHGGYGNNYFARYPRKA